ncbi:pyocin S6 family toxin immunity protein [Pseudomonas sp. DSP3-2-2]|uniref:pyocin S6 family toxin immunity protein n=1 Tax=unclassified Pseudomonas TaxID=196821 RepID=UPI003CF36742
MPFLVISGFYPEPIPDNALHYQRVVPQELEIKVLNAIGWGSLSDVPPGVTDLTRDQAMGVMAALADPIQV